MNSGRSGSASAGPGTGSSDDAGTEPFAQGFFGGFDAAGGHDAGPGHGAQDVLHEVGAAHGAAREHLHDLDAQLLELAVIVREVFQLGRADEREVGRVEDDGRPLALQGVLSDVDELAVLIGGCRERLDLGVDQ